MIPIRGRKLTFHTVLFNVRDSWFVKLNSPLMGTKITYQAGGFHILTRPHVKLTAPLMGTEIIHYLEQRIYIFLVAS